MSFHLVLIGFWSMISPIVEVFKDVVSEMGSGEEYNQNYF